MEFKEFIDRLEQNLKVALEDGPGNAKVEVRPVEKMQGESYTAITITPNDGNLGMNLNADALYKLMEEGASYQSVVARALSQATSFLEDSHSFDVNSITDYANAKPKLFVEVVGAERNEEMLAKVPHKQIEDMAMVYRIQVESKEDGLASVLVTNALLMVIVHEYVDDGYSGVNFDRPEFKQMMEDIKAKEVDCIICKDLSRFARNYIDSGRYLEKIFPFMGVRFIAINDNYDSFGEKSQSDSLVIPFKNLINDAYCKDISMKIRSQLDIKRKMGEFIGSFSPYGYRKSDENKNKLLIDEKAADVVELIFRYRLNGMSNSSIAEKLNSMGIHSPMEYKVSEGMNFKSGFRVNNQGKWNAVAIQRILTNEVYVGTLIQHICIWRTLILIMGGQAQIQIDQSFKDSLQIYRRVRLKHLS